MSRLLQRSVLVAIAVWIVSIVSIAAGSMTPAGAADLPAASLIAASKLEALCQPAAMQAVASRLKIKVIVQPLPKDEIPGPFLTGGTRFTPSANGLPSYCQVTGSYVTNPKTGKTANFLATLPSEWNQKYLQLGCGGHCGTFAVSDAASPTITITNQGKPGDSIRKGYASFATDEGHAGFHQGTWAVKESGEIDQDALDDFLYRADEVLAQMGKQFTAALYAEASGTSRKIAYSYFCGCSGGGRDALVAASYFPEEFDGIVAGSAYANMANLAFLSTGVSLATTRSPDATISPALLTQVNAAVLAKCDAVDGVKDGLIQNPMACDFRPDKDLPHCSDDKPGDQCFTQAQIESLSTFLTAATDEQGRMVQPGYSVSEIQGALLAPPQNAGTPDPWPDGGNPATGASGGMGLLADAAMKMGIGDVPENAARLIRLNHKLLIWANLSDHLLTPYMSVNYYKRLAKLYGGYDKLQKNVRLFGLPGTAHCSGGGIGEGPGSFDALAAIEDWVERDRGPDSLEATPVSGTMFGVDFSKPAGRSMPLCKFPEMAHYSGSGDVKDGANWSCPANDTSMLTLGESGKQAGVVQ